jgi:hypothetical protein
VVNESYLSWPRPSILFAQSGLYDDSAQASVHIPRFSWYSKLFSPSYVILNSIELCSCNYGLFGSLPHFAMLKIRHVTTIFWLLFPALPNLWQSFNRILVHFLCRNLSKLLRLFCSPNFRHGRTRAVWRSLNTIQTNPTYSFRKQNQPCKLVYIHTCPTDT